VVAESPQQQLPEGVILEVEIPLVEGKPWSLLQQQNGTLDLPIDQQAHNSRDSIAVQDRMTQGVDDQLLQQQKLIFLTRLGDLFATKVKGIALQNWWIRWLVGGFPRII